LFRRQLDCLQHLHTSIQVWSFYTELLAQDCQFTAQSSYDKYLIRYSKHMASNNSGADMEGRLPPE